MKKKYPQKQREVASSRVPHPLITSAIVIFLYLVYIRVQLIIQSDVDVYTSIVNTQDSPNPRSKPRTKSADSGDNRATPFDVRDLARYLTTEFSAEDGIPSDERKGFDIAFTDSTNPNPCFCDVVSTDCLHTIACIPDLHNPERRNALAWLGVQFRRAIRATAEFDRGFKPYEWNEIPLGKMLQYHTIEVWKDWRKLNIFPKTFNKRKNSIFVNETLYPDCTKKGRNGALVPKLKGVSCFYKGPIEPEEISTDTTIEYEANRWFNATIERREETRRMVDTTLEIFLRKHHPPSDSDRTYSREESLFSVAENDSHFSPRGNLMLFAHIMRILFNRRSFLDKIYKEKVTFVETPGSNKWSTQYNDDPFILSVHMRRGDSCGWPDPKDYLTEASPLDSPAQTGGDRQCYRTGVYINAIERIRALVPKTRPLHVHLATDDVGDVIQEILTAFRDAGENALGVDKWHFLNYSRSVFNYDAEVIEDIENRAAQPLLGETAVQDLWHLSHGHALVGHLGSRFGKVSWLLATARRNDFVPFFSVDGHSK